MPEGASYYRYQDAQGRVHLVDSLEQVPKKLRESATKIEIPAHTSEATLGDKVGEAASDLSDRAELQVYKATEITHGVINRTPFASTLHAPAVGGAVGALVGAGLLFLVWRRRGPWWLRFVLGFLAAGLLGGAYLGWVRRQAGLPSDAITSPKALIEDAQRAVERANERQRANEQGLFELEQQ